MLLKCVLRHISRSRSGCIGRRLRGQLVCRTCQRTGDSVTNAERSANGESRTVDLGGRVHYVDFGGPDDAPTVVLVHGLGGSHLNWDLFAPRLTERARVLAVDLPGFGLSEPGHRIATVQNNVTVLDQFIREVAGTPVVLVG